MFGNVFRGKCIQRGNATWDVKLNVRMGRGIASNLSGRMVQEGNGRGVVWENFSGQFVPRGTSWAWLTDRRTDGQLFSGYTCTIRSAS